MQRFFLIALILSGAVQTWACSCSDDFISFCDLLSNSTEFGQNALLVRISATAGDDRVADVLDVVLGTANYAELSLISGPGSLCGVNLDNLMIGETLLVVGTSTDNSTFIPNVCNERFTLLKVEAGKVAYPKASNPAENDFFSLAEIQAGNLCPTKLAPGQFWKVFPNPTPDLLRIDTLQTAPGTQLAVSVYAGNGQRVLQQDLPANYPLDIDLESFSNGLYWVTILADDRRQTFKIVKMR